MVDAKNRIVKLSMRITAFVSTLALTIVIPLAGHTVARADVVSQNSHIVNGVTLSYDEYQEYISLKTKIDEIESNGLLDIGKSSVV
ncbi:MAG: hypothetical protein LBI63_04775 [Candidatus Ancillula sp.]|jgi:hypothetical protein|nr:hypothetical protein [Candidatus Ancillula sp.]